jgi:hypothetical protein
MAVYFFGGPRTLSTGSARYTIFVYRVDLVVSSLAANETLHNKGRSAVSDIRTCNQGIPIESAAMG